MTLIGVQMGQSERMEQKQYVNGAEAVCEETLARIFPKLQKDIKLQS